MTDKYLSQEQLDEIKKKEDLALHGNKEYLEYLGGLLGGGVVVGAFFAACPPIGIYLLYDTAKHGGPSKIVKRWVVENRIMEEEVEPCDGLDKIIKNS